MHSIRLSFLSISLAFLSCGLIINQAQSQVQPQSEQQQKVSFPSGDAYKNSTITYKLIPGINNTWGYDILVDDRTKIHQPSIPGLPGNEGFKTKEGAEKVAKLVISKTVNEELFRALPRIGAIGFSIGERGYIGTGLGYFENIPIFQKDFWEYNPHTDSWTQKADFGGTARYYAVGFSIGTKGYIGTGKNCDGPIFGLTKDFWEYDPGTNSWTQKTDFGGTARSAAVGFSICDKGYIGTGYRIDNLKDFWEYNPNTDTWVRVADFPGIARYTAVGFSIGTKGYVGTGINYMGSNECTFPGDFYEYDPEMDLWTQKNTFEGMGRAFAVGFSIGDMGYIGTGISSNGFTKDFWEYDPINDTWSRKTDFWGTQRSGATGFSIGTTRGYIGSGVTKSSQYFQDFWEYNQIRNGWTRKSDLGKKHKGALKEANATGEICQAVEPNLMVYPNPSTSIFNFRLETMSKELVTIQLFDISGRLVHEYHSLSPDEVITLGDNLVKGVFIAVITQGEYRKSVKITKVH